MGELIDDNWMRELRYSRSNPPGLAAADEERREIYNAALEQFEELLGAAERIGVAAKPLTMFYALSQAGRAIAAARTPDDTFRIKGHGLRPARGVERSRDVMRSLIERARRDDGSDAFSVVSRAVGSPDFDGRVEFGAVWAATPDLHRLPDDAWQEDWRGALDLDFRTGEWPTTGLTARLVSWDGNPLIAFDENIAGYPPLANDHTRFLSRLEPAPGVDEPEPGLWSVIVEWDREGMPFASGSLPSGLHDEPRIIPPLPGQSESQDPLMLVWLLLFSMSIFARYEPGTWSRALQIQSSTRAVPLGAIMDQLSEAMPLLAYDAIMRPGAAEPTDPPEDSTSTTDRNMEAPPA